MRCRMWKKIAHCSTEQTQITESNRGVLFMYFCGKAWNQRLTNFEHSVNREDVFLLIRGHLAQCIHNWIVNSLSEYENAITLLMCCAKYHPKRMDAPITPFRKQSMSSIVHLIFPFSSMYMKNYHIISVLSIRQLDQLTEAEWRIYASVS